MIKTTKRPWELCGGCGTVHGTIEQAVTDSRGRVVRIRTCPHMKEEALIVQGARRVAATVTR